MKTKLDAIRETLRNLEDEQFVQVYNRFCELKGWQEMMLLENTEENLQMLLDAGGETVSYDPKDKYIYCSNLRGSIRTTSCPVYPIYDDYDEFVGHIDSFYFEYKDVLPLTTYQLQLKAPHGNEKYRELYYDLEEAAEAALDELERLERSYPDFDKQLETKKQNDLMFNSEWAWNKCRFDLELCKYVGDDIEEFKPEDFEDIRHGKDFAERFETNGWAVSKKSFWNERW
jgi:hypothetical protein